jgi:hypothetical protein
MGNSISRHFFLCKAHGVNEKERLPVDPVKTERDLFNAAQEMLDHVVPDEIVRRNAGITAYVLFQGPVITDPENV